MRKTDGQMERDRDRDSDLVRDGVINLGRGKEKARCRERET